MSLITVSQYHIDQGERWDTQRCPNALAVRAAYPKFSGVSVYRDVYLMTDYEESGIIQVAPPEVIQFAMRFDLEEPVKPYTFELDDTKWELGSSSLRSLTSLLALL